jgi:hypothetical protein
LRALSANSRDAKTWRTSAYARWHRQSEHRCADLFLDLCVYEGEYRVFGLAISRALVSGRH